MPRRHEWRTPSWALDKFRRLAIELDDLDPDSEIAHAIRDEIRSLPNYPHREAELDYLIVPVDSTLR